MEMISEYIQIGVKLLIGMICVVTYIRFSGKTQMVQLSPINVINMIILGTLVGGTIYTAGYLIIVKMLFAFVIWAIINWFVRIITRNNKWGHMIHGKTEFLIKNGKLNLECLQRNNLTIEQLIAKLRSLSIFSLLDIDDVLYETDGSMTIYKRRNFPESYLLVTNGQIREEDLKDAKQTKTWLRDELKRRDFSKIEDLICVQWTVNEGFYIVDNEGTIHAKNDEKQIRGNKGRRPNNRRRPAQKQEQEVTKSVNKKDDHVVIISEADAEKPKRRPARRRRPKPQEAEGTATDTKDSSTDRSTKQPTNESKKEETKE